ncbi:zinc finger protein 556-like [Dipodomys spectabilis]|uniref:zinc finger protein 556-like n=1 Tax=Dipodomys spectabilis TaxID=105255 RepID=UPI001C53C7B3|nr:zinc finger protein 556-like [Dipodomys spectabilis]
MREEESRRGAGRCQDLVGSPKEQSPVLSPWPSTHTYGLLQDSVAFEDVAVDFSPREWALLTPAQRRLYREVVLDIFQALASIGKGNMAFPRRHLESNHSYVFMGYTCGPEYAMMQVSVTRSRRAGGRGPGRRPRGAPAGPGRRYECGRCGNVFTHPSSLQRHIRIHTGQKPHKCGVCGKAFSRPSYLRTHEKTHSGEKPHACGVCGKAFLRPYSLTVHARVHTGEKPFECARCGRPFSCPKSFRAHVLAHTAGKPYRCAQCGKAYRCPRSARVHARLHAGERLHECARCGKAYGWLASLQKHVRVHDGEKPYSCTRCGKAFGWPSSLHKHARAHARKAWASGARAGARPVRPAPAPAQARQEARACATCGKAFAQRSSLRRHTRTHALEPRAEESGRPASVQDRLGSHTGHESGPDQAEEPGGVAPAWDPRHAGGGGPGEDPGPRPEK